MRHPTETPQCPCLCILAELWYYEPDRDASFPELRKTTKLFLKSHSETEAHRKVHIYMQYVYILLLKNNKFYTGTTENLERRFYEHESGKVESTKNLRPTKLIHYEAYILKSDAERRERFLKTTEGKRLLRQQIRDFLIKYKIELGSPYHPIGRHVG